MDRQIPDSVKMSECNKDCLNCKYYESYINEFGFPFKYCNLYQIEV